MSTRLSFSRLAAIAVLGMFWMVCVHVSRAAEASSDVEVSVTVEHPAVSSTGGGTGGGGGGSPTPSGGLRPESLILKILGALSRSAPDRPVSPFTPDDIIPDTPQVPDTEPPDTGHAAAQPEPGQGRKPTVIHLSEGPWAPLLCLGSPLACMNDRYAEPVCRELTLSCVWNAVNHDAFLALGTLFPDTQTLLRTPISEQILWLLWILLYIVLLVWVMHHGTKSAHRTHVDSSIEIGTHATGTLSASPLSARTFVHTALIALGTLSIIWLVFSFWEGSRAANIDVSVTIVSTDLGFSCSDSVSLGTIPGTGDTGAYDAVRSTTCTVLSTVAGYTLSWEVRSGSGGVNTGSLIGTHNGLIEPFAATVDAPTAWGLTATGSAWGGRLSSASTTTDTSLWGVDGVSERWAGVASGTSAILAVRASPTGAGGDSEIVGFRAALGNATNAADDTYSTVITFTAVSP